MISVEMLSLTAGVISLFLGIASFALAIVAIFLSIYHEKSARESERAAREAMHRVQHVATDINTLVRDINAKQFSQISKLMIDQHSLVEKSIDALIYNEREERTPGDFANKEGKASEEIEKVIGKVEKE
uniref:Uncharacterized protein n=1 Tax=Candidatus Kentrum sp. FW TaxID=2126338 RepID=A0A450SX89_9GAMM|nr:MAG: hypothetical protein BECKFW1821B_GA0114236_102421 [Candidatus Kentron sp. FW]VFJ58633.1 MAG: hypothetical protein BECKFW1821A_GA0114235_108411 [Candidatus Kentron sp. FW]